MKMPHNSLITDRIPLLLLERAALSVSQGSIISKTKKGKSTIPVSMIHCLLLGNGTSVTSEVAMTCAKHNCYISFLRGGCNIHSIWHAGRYPNPKFLVKQVQLHTDPKNRLDIAKFLMNKRLDYLDSGLDVLLSPERVDATSNIEELLGVEGSLAKRMYAKMAAKNELKFIRNFDSLDPLNRNLSLCNNALYNFIATIVISLGLSPSIGFLHGQTRRGGLVFDIADVFKYPIFMKDLFNRDLTGNSSEILRTLSSRLMEKRKFWVKEIIHLIQSLLEFA